jgi:hypothetical protein
VQSGFKTHSTDIHKQHPFETTNDFLDAASPDTRHVLLRNLFAMSTLRTFDDYEAFHFMRFLYRSHKVKTTRK